jgi:NDP-sugar pyrophosphorylase family protein
MKAVILAGGLGHRLRPFTDVIPKPLLPLGERSILEVQISALARAGAREVIVATNYKSQLLEAFLGDGSRFGLRIIISREQKPLGTAGPLSLLRDRLDRPFIVMNGDILTRMDFARFYEVGTRQNADLTVGTKIMTIPFRYGSVHVDSDEGIIDVEEKPEFTLEIVAGVYCMKPSIFRYIPDNEYFGMDALMKRIIAAHERVARYLIDDYWVDIGQVDDYSKARSEYEQYFGDETRTA